MSEPAPELRVVDEAVFEPGTPVTVAWYKPGEPDAPEGTVVMPDRADMERLRREVEDDGEERRLVHWRGIAWRRWERISDLRVNR